MLKVTDVLMLTALAIAVSGAATAKDFGPWEPAAKVADPSGEVNTAFNDGCPIQSPDGLSLYIASNRPGGLGGLDIWVAQRPNKDAGWGAPQNLGPAVNSQQDDFCPTPIPGNGLFFVSKRLEPNGDIYRTRQGQNGWETPERLAFDSNGTAINSPAQEWSPAYYEDDAGRPVLYFSSTRPGGPGGQDIYFSVSFGPAQLAQGLNTPADDARPNVRRDGREIVFDSTRPTGFGGPDIWSATRTTASGPWTAPVNLGPNINSPAGESRASLSWDGLTMVFGSNRAGAEGPAPGTTVLQADVHQSTRERLLGQDKLGQAK